MGVACSSHVRGETAYSVLVGKPKGKRPLEDLDIGEKIIVKCTLGM